jgi:uncharacterized OB-fold protein
MADEQELTPGATVSRCQKCRVGWVPLRLLCPRCGYDVLLPEKVHEAVVEQTTCVRHSAGAENWTPRHLASVRTTENQVLIVGLDGPVKDGTRVKLYERGMAMFGKAQ